MDKKACYYLGYISKAVGFKGEVVLTLDTDETEYYRELESIYVEINRKLVPFFFERIINHKKNHLRVKLEGVDTEADARALIKKQIYLPLTLLPQLDEDKFYYHEIIGFEVIEEVYGSCGLIVDVMETAANPVLKVDKEGKEVLIPLQDEFLKQVDKKKRVIHVTTPPGLIEMYLGQ